VAGPESVSKGHMQCDVSQWESETDMCNGLEKANFNEDVNVQWDISDAETLEIAVINAL